MVKKAVIMAGGEGQRMLPLSDYLPKCYLPIFDRPLLIKQISWLASIGVEELIIIVDNKFGSIIASLLSMAEVPKEISIDVVMEEQARGIGYALLETKGRLEDKPFAFLLGDEYYHRPTFFQEVRDLSAPCLLLGVTRYSNVDLILQGCNLILDEDNKVIKGLIEKPKKEKVTSPWCWNGFAVFNHSVLEELELECKKTFRKDNGVLVDALNNLIKSNIQIQFLIEENENINLTTPDDYYRAFCLEYQVFKGGK